MCPTWKSTNISGRNRNQWLGDAWSLGSLTRRLIVGSWTTNLRNFMVATSDAVIETSSFNFKRFKRSSMCLSSIVLNRTYILIISYIYIYIYFSCSFIFLKTISQHVTADCYFSLSHLSVKLGHSNRSTIPKAQLRSPGQHVEHLKTQTFTSSGSWERSNQKVWN